MPWGNVRSTAVRIRHQVACCAALWSRLFSKSPPDQSFTAVSASLAVSCRSAQRSKELPNLTILSVKSQWILRMLLQSLRALCLVPGGSGSIQKYIEVLVKSPGVSGRIACSFQTYLNFADVTHFPGVDEKQSADVLLPIWFVDGHRTVTLLHFQ